VHDRFSRYRFTEVFVPAYMVSGDGEQEPDDEHVGMEEVCGIHHGRLVPRKIGRERDKDDGNQDQDVDP